MQQQTISLCGNVLLKFDHWIICYYYLASIYSMEIDIKHREGDGETHAVVIVRITGLEQVTKSGPMCSL